MLKSVIVMKDANVIRKGYRYARSDMSLSAFIAKTTWYRSYCVGGNGVLKYVCWGNRSEEIYFKEIINYIYSNYSGYFYYPIYVW